MSNKTDIIQKGADIMAPVFKKYGFVFSIEGEGQSSGGEFAFGSWCKGNRRLEFHYRYTLGLVNYFLGEERIGHQWYLWAVTGKKHSGSYPGNSEDPVDSFSRLKNDIEKYCDIFLQGSDNELLTVIKKGRELYKWWESLPPLKRLEVK
ncbi:hypothetical protein [Desulfosarcina cetonica]|uniref:hypothetical protein n=1 Tax=Desulfosarcina cetonica TaxID=90730 RepID=UPI0012EE36B0|nr:hypothetical protein [Desulfosarcina cetonica]